jgi:hypothetical protein
MGRGSVNANVSIVGLKFQRGTWTPPSVLFLGNGITANSVTPLAFSAIGITVNSGTRTSATQLTVVISLSGSAVVGLRDVAVANPDAGWYTLANGFTVLN